MLDYTVACKERHQRFIERVLKLNHVWGLKSKQGWVVCPSNKEEGKEVMPFWSNRAYAAQCAKEEWKGYEPTAISLEDFLTKWLSGMAKDGFLVGTNWNANLIGLESDPFVLKAELEKIEKK